MLKLWILKLWILFCFMNLACLFANRFFDQNWGFFCLFWHSKENKLSADQNKQQFLWNKFLIRIFRIGCICTEWIKNLSFTENICQTSVVEYLCLIYNTYSCLRSNSLSVIMVTACGAESNRPAKLLWGHAIFLRWFTLWFRTWSLQLLHQKYAKVIIKMTFNFEST